MASRIAALIGTATLLTTVQLVAQQPDVVLRKLRDYGLAEASGAVPVLYVKSVQERAMRCQKSLTVAHAWFQEQLNVKVPIALAVLDAETWGKVTNTKYPMPHNLQASGDVPRLVIFPDRMPSNTSALIDRDHGPGGVLEGEGVLFHEDGHILASSLRIRSGNEFVNELIAHIFRAGYINAERQELRLPEDRKAAIRDARRSNPPRYTSLADLDYLYDGVGPSNYYWFQGWLGELAEFLVQDQNFPILIEKLQKAFPVSEAKQETLEAIDARLETIRPGFLRAAGTLAGPTTIPRITPSTCHESSKGPGPSTLVIDNRTDDPLAVTFPNGHTNAVPAHTWRVARNMPVGSALKLPNGTCLVVRDEPTLAVIGRL